MKGEKRNTTTPVAVAETAVITRDALTISLAATGSESPLSAVSLTTAAGTPHVAKIPASAITFHRIARTPNFSLPSIRETATEFNAYASFDTTIALRLYAVPRIMRPRSDTQDTSLFASDRLPQAGCSRNQVDASIIGANNNPGPSRAIRQNRNWISLLVARTLDQSR